MKMSVKFIATFCLNIWQHRWQEIIGIVAYYMYEAILRGSIIL